MRVELNRIRDIKVVGGKQCISFESIENIHTCILVLSYPFILQDVINSVTTVLE